MQAVIEQKTSIDITSIYAMRYSGATLQQIAERIGRTKERVRQILSNNYGSTKHKLFSTRQLCKLSGLSRSWISKLHEDNVITPAREWITNTGHRFLWSLATVERARICSHIPRSNRLCRICNRPIPIERQRYCSEQCYKESHKYKYRSIEARQRHLISMKKYKENRRQLAQVTR